AELITLVLLRLILYIQVVQHIPESVVIYLTHRPYSLLTQSQHTLNHLLGRVHHFHVHLERTGSRDHVGHFFDRINVGIKHITFVISHGMIRLITTLQRRIAFHHAQHLHTGADIIRRGKSAIKRIAALHGCHRLTLDGRKHRLTVTVYLISAGAG